MSVLLMVLLDLDLHGSKWHWPSLPVMNHSKAERSYWMCRQKSCPQALSGKRSEGGRSGMRKDPIVAKELRVQRHPDTGILLNKAGIVQWKNAYWHKKDPNVENVTWGFRHLHGFQSWYDPQMADTLIAFRPALKSGHFAEDFQRGCM